MTTFRSGPTGPVMTTVEFGQGAMDNSLSWSDTLGAAAADTFLKLPTGTLIREAQTPELAREVVGGGRGGVQWRDEKPEQVEARGDQLLDTPEKFKSSPSYRKAIPQEKGMTESRLKVLAEFHDVSKVREFYAAKRPGIAIVGGILGSIPEPLNFIPIVRAGTAIASASRLARIGHSAAVGAADAAANSAIFQTAFARQAGKFGDDTSWQAIATNAAFSALAGTVIGGGIGALTRAPKVAANVQAAVAAVVPDRLGTAGDVTARFGDVSRATVEPQTTVDVSGGYRNLEDFTGSKIVDRRGDLLTVYHGSDQDITEFRSGGESGEGNYGIYFTKDPKKASGYASHKFQKGRRQDEERGAVYPVHLDVRNPLVIDAPSFWAKIKAKASGSDATRGSKRLTAFLTEREVSDYKSRGYDGVVNEASDEIIVFDSSQIKSAIEPRRVNRASSYTGTVEMRAKAVAVMNEAIYSALTYGDIRLGPNAQAHVAEVGAAVQKAASSGQQAVVADPGRSDLLALVDRGAPISELLQSVTLREAVAAQKAMRPTNELPGYGTPEFEASRKFKFGDETVTGYDNAVSRLVGVARAYSGGTVRQEGKAVIVLGPPAAGKSSIADPIARHYGAAIPDPDDAKKVIPDYQNGLGATAVHEESSRLSGHVYQRLLSSKTNLVLPKIGGNADGIAKLIKALKVEGYTVELINLRTSPDEAFRRMLRRFVATGRLVNPEYTMSIANKPHETYVRLRDEKIADDHAEFDGHTPFGQFPARIEGTALRSLDGPGRNLDQGNAGGPRTLAGGKDPEVKSAPRPEPNYSAPTPVTLSPRFTESLTRVEANAKPAPEPLARDIEAAKREGFDPETGEHDLADDVAAMKEQGVLTPEEELALKAADENFAVAQGWEDVMNVARTCVLT